MPSSRRKRRRDLPATPVTKTPPFLRGGRRQRGKKARRVAAPKQPTTTPPNERQKKRGSDVDRRGIAQLQVVAVAHGLCRPDENGKMGMPRGGWKDMEGLFLGIGKRTIRRWVSDWDRSRAQETFPDFTPRRLGKCGRPAHRT